MTKPTVTFWLSSIGILITLARQWSQLLHDLAPCGTFCEQQSWLIYYSHTWFSAMTCDALVCTMGIGFSTTSVLHCDWVLCSLECLDGSLPEPSGASPAQPNKCEAFTLSHNCYHMLSLFCWKQSTVYLSHYVHTYIWSLYVWLCRHTVSQSY